MNAVHVNYSVYKFYKGNQKTKMTV